ncbi:Histidine kinase-, DNA gyrase B-, and HSP90-like ATPase [Aquimarina amphilecti]|uniref:Oxygen sensor histidine kinase NreB n=1 Tax=Aquimarina amphilecti TaxID=1038014 RepID=A0A1H7FQD8_AQUAM|nr:sensor histidine kinase [Aquimarina amphilecti]SEK28313.1 Histidine kinase-, DNA gyrase B-, and HSP90-like ATPase [Aquimarina amphilecti]
MEKELLQEDSQIIVVILIAIMVLLLMAVSLVLFFFFSRKKIVAAELEKANMAISYQRDLIHGTIETQEEERKRIAQDLHDAISAKLNVVSLSTNVLIDGKLDKKEQEQTLQHILSVTTKTLESSRRLAHNLLPPILENFGLQAAIEELCDEFISSKKIKVNYTVVYHDLFSKSNELHIFRIIQELLNNSVRHGKAANVVLNIDETDQELTIEYSDDGKGFDIQSIHKNKGIGLKNIESRVEILNGILSYQSEVGNGATFTISTKKPKK